jgi:putative hydrolase of the HAD superfamily
VLVTSPFELIKSAGAKDGGDGEALLELMLGPYDEDTDHPWHQVERGEMAIADYGRWLIAEVQDRGLNLPGRMMQDMKPHDVVVDRARALRADGYRTAVLTNNAKEVSDEWRSIVPVDELFDLVVDSSEVGMRKPNPAIYTYTADLLDVPPERCIFLDDAPGNIIGAQNAGMQAILVGLDADAAIRTLDRLLSAHDA